MKSEFQLDLTGRITFIYNQARITVKTAKLYIVKEDGKISIFELVIEFNPEDIEKLIVQFPVMKNSKETEYYTYSFEMLQSIIDKIAADLFNTNSLEEFLKVQNFACVRLENYSCTGYPKYKKLS